MGILVKKCIIRIIILFVYGTLGAWVFYELEKNPETNLGASKRIITQLRQEFEGKCNLTEEDFNRFLNKSQKAFLLIKKLDWTYARSIMFVMASLTTIGYGNITPQKPESQGIFIIYCVIGLPITMLALKTSGELLCKGYKAAIVCIEKRIFSNPDPRNLGIKTLIVSLVASFLAIAVMGFIQTLVDDWTVIEGIYAWAVTLSTIGFGDYIPFMSKIDKLPREDYAILATAATLIPVLFLLSMVSSCLNSLTDAIEVLRPKLEMITFCKCYGRESRVLTAPSAEICQHCNKEKLAVDWRGTSENFSEAASNGNHSLLSMRMNEANKEDSSESITSIIPCNSTV